MAIYIVTGRPRNGKSFFIARMIPDWIKRAQEEKGEFRIYSNIKINLEPLGISEEVVGDIYSEVDRKNPNKLIFYWRNIDTWNVMERGVIIVDEAQRYFNARKWALLSEDTEIKIQQHGHEDLDIWGTTQHYTRIDITMRVLVELFFVVGLTFGKPDNRSVFKIARWSAYTIEEIQKLENVGRLSEEEEEQIPSGWFWIWNKYGRLYDTRQMILASKPMPLKHELRTCPDCGHEQIKHS